MKGLRSRHDFRLTTLSRSKHDSCISQYATCPTFISSVQRKGNETTFIV